MGWLQLVGSIRLQVSFAKEPCKRDNILQKRLISILPTAATHMKTRQGKASYGSSPPRIYLQIYAVYILLTNVYRPCVSGQKKCQVPMNCR